MEEKRRTVRIDLCMDVTYEILPMCQGMFPCMARNISEGGMCFLSRNEVVIASIIRLRFILPDEARTRMECLARVVWQKKVDAGYLVGIEFRDQDLKIQIKIGVFVLKFNKELEDLRLSIGQPPGA